MKPFLDTNILVYAQQGGVKGEQARALLRQGCVVSVQVLTELVNVLRRKFNRDWTEIEQVLTDVHAVTGEPIPLTGATQKLAFRLASLHGFSIFDATILAAAVSAGCPVVYSEDMQSGRSVGGLVIKNPFAGL